VTVKVDVLLAGPTIII